MYGLALHTAPSYYDWLGSVFATLLWYHSIAQHYNPTSQIRSLSVGSAPIVIIIVHFDRFVFFDLSYHLIWNVVVVLFYTIDSSVLSVSLQTIVMPNVYSNPQHNQTDGKWSVSVNALLHSLSLSLSLFPLSLHPSFHSPSLSSFSFHSLSLPVLSPLSFRSLSPLFPLSLLCFQDSGGTQSKWLLSHDRFETAVSIHAFAIFYWDTMEKIFWLKADEPQERENL